MTTTSISTSCIFVTYHLKNIICSFIWASKKYNNFNLDVGTWSVRPPISVISKYGSENYIANLPQSSRYNKTYTKKHLIQKLAMRPKYSQKSINMDRSVVWADWRFVMLPKEEFIYKRCLVMPMYLKLATFVIISEPITIVDIFCLKVMFLLEIKNWKFVD